MPNPSIKPLSKTQAKKLTEKARAKIAEQKAYEKQLARNIKAEQRKRDRELTAVLKNVRGKGIYDPKSFELTKWRKAQARKLKREYGDLINPEKSFFVKIDKGLREATLKNAKSLELTTTRTGIFMAKDNYKAIKVKREKSGELSIVRSGKIKRGPNAGKRYTAKTPLVPIDEMENIKDNLRGMAESMGPLNNSERLTFEVNENGVEGFAKSTFTNIDHLIEYLDRYHKTPGAKINFLRHVKIVKVESSDKWFRMHPPKIKIRKMKMNIKGRNA